MTAIGPILFPVALLFCAGVCYFGIRRDRPPWSILALIAFLILGVWGWLYLEDLGRLWSGRERKVDHIGVEVIPALGFVTWKLRTWFSLQEARSGRGLRRTHLRSMGRHRGA